MFVAHADWGTNSNKQWVVHGRRRPDGRWAASAPVRVGEAGSLLERMGVPAGGDPVVLGFDSPIGVPAAYARRAGITHFPAFLREAGEGPWAAFFEVADAPEEISLQRPFYPRSGLPKGSKRRAQLTSALGIGWAELLRRCERAQPDRREACSLFWTLGGNQVGKGALAGWRLLQAAPNAAVSFWPFDGPLDRLVQPGRVVVTETYPAEAAHHIGVGRVVGKQHQLVRRSHAPALLRFAEQAGITLDEAIRALIEDGFGSSSSGEDPFDAVVGLFGMINVLAGGRPANDPPDDAVRTVEGWILGQAARSPGAWDGDGDTSPSMLLQTCLPIAEPDEPDQHARLGPPPSANLESPPKRGPLWTTEPVDAGWLRQVVVLVEHAIDQLVLKFVALPYLHRVEHSLHFELYSLLTANRTLGRPYQMADGAWTQLVHKEWPETVARPAKAGRRGNFDMVILDPTALRQATIAEFQDGLVKPVVVIEIGLNYGAQHLRDDVNKLANSAIDHSYVVHLSRNPVHHHPDLVEELHRPSVQIAAALAGRPTRRTGSCNVRRERPRRLARRRSHSGGHDPEHSHPNDSSERRGSGGSGRARTKTSWLSMGGFVGAGARQSVTGQIVWPVVVMWLQGLGSDFAEEPVFRCEPVTLATETFLECPARTR